MRNIEEFPSFILIKELIASAPFSKFVQMSSICAKQLGWKNSEEAYGYSDYDIPSKMANSALQFVNLDTLSLRNRKKLISIEFQNYSTGWKGMLVERIPMPPDHIAIQAIEITKTPFFNMAYSLVKFDRFHGNNRETKGISYIIEEEHCELPLSPRQKECLFYLVRGKTAKHIANILGIDHRTVESHIFHMKDKLGCNTREQLIERAFESGFAYFIPKSLIRVQNNYI